MSSSNSDDVRSFLTSQFSILSSPALRYATPALTSPYRLIALHRQAQKEANPYEQ